MPAVYPQPTLANVILKGVAWFKCRKQECAAWGAAVAAERIWIGTEPGFDRERYASRWRKRIDQLSSAVLVATVGDRIGGFGDVYPDAEYGQLLSLHVFLHNERAIALYKNSGFAEVAQEPDHSTRQDGEIWAAILMSKDLCY